MPPLVDAPAAEQLPVAPQWFARTALPDGITRLTEPWVHPLLRSHVWHVRGRDRDLIVDTGLGVGPIRSALADLIDRPVIAVATHIHYDHIGGLHAFADRRMHRLEAPLMADFTGVQWLRRDDFSIEQRRGLAAAGQPIDGPFLIDARPAADFDPATWRIKSAPVQPLDEGDVIDLGDRWFTVLHLPGHTPGCIGLWSDAEGILFSGDAIYDEGPLLDGLPESDVAAYRRTMERLITWPARVVHPGHGPSFGRARMIEIAEAYLRATERLGQAGNGATRR